MDRGSRLTAAVDDPDFVLYVGDVRDVLAELEPGSVDCVVTSPPYWGLRDYGTGSWAGGDPDCDHLVRLESHAESSTLGGGKATTGHQREGFKDICGRCGATRVDRQIGLEQTPDEYVTTMVDVFREVRRVLADHGTVWLNLGDSYNNRSVGRQSSHQGGLGFESDDLSKSWAELTQEGRTRLSINDGVLKEKDLVGIPWRVAFALQADGWYLRSDIIWAKPNPMPESVTDRPTKAHEYVFLLSKRPRYFFDQEAVREKYQDGPGLTGGAYSPPGQSPHGNARGPDGTKAELTPRRDGDRWNEHNGRGFTPTNGGRNIRSVWEIATQPYPEAHFATFPEELARRCILAGCPTQVCGTCGKARERIVERGELVGKDRGGNYQGRDLDEGLSYLTETVGWSDCGHDAWRPGRVLDPFMGSGTTAKVARDHGRHAVGIELSPVYAELCARRLQQLSLFAEAAP